MKNENTVRSLTTCYNCKSVHNGVHYTTCPICGSDDLAYTMASAVAEAILADFANNPLAKEMR